MEHIIFVYIPFVYISAQIKSAVSTSQFLRGYIIYVGKTRWHAFFWITLNPIQNDSHEFQENSNKFILGKWGKLLGYIL